MAAPTVYKTVTKTTASAPTETDKTKMKANVSAFFNHFNAKHLS